MGKGGTVSVLAFLAVMALANTVLAQNLTENQTLLQSSFANAQCKVSFTTSFIGDITGAAPSLNSLGADSAAIRADSSVLSSLAASGNVNLDGEARFLANEQELALGNAVTGIAVGIGAGAVLSAVADTNTVGSAGFTAGEFNAAAGFGSLGVAAGFTAAVTAAFSGNAALAGTVASSGVALRTCYGAATLTAAPATCRRPRPA